MFVNPLPMDTDIRSVQFLKAFSPIVLTLLGMFNSTNPLPSNADGPIKVTEFGISVKVKLLQWVKAKLSIFVQELPITTSFMGFAIESPLSRQKRL